MSQPIVYDVSDYAMTPERERIHRKMLNIVRALAPTSVLEIGAGIGTLGSQIAALGCRYVGIEPDEAEFTQARQAYPNVNFVRGSCYDEPAAFGLGKFDLVISNDVIEHLYLPRKMVGFAKQHLAAGGAVVTATPDYGNYLRNLTISLFSRWDHHHSALWDGGHIKFFSRTTLQRLFAEQGFSSFEWDSVRSVRAPIFPMSLVCIARLEAARP